MYHIRKIHAYACFSSLNLGAKRKLTSKMAAGHIQPMMNSRDKTAGEY